MGLEAGRYPIFVAEGDSTKKLAQINRNAYLAYCLGKFQRIENALVVFGHSLGPSDRHMTSAIVQNEKLARLYISLYGPADSEANKAVIASAQQMQARRKSIMASGVRTVGLEVSYFQAESAFVWDEPAGSPAALVPPSAPAPAPSRSQQIRRARA